MPARPAYFHRLSETIQVLEKLEIDWIDRQTLQEILGVSKTVAWRLFRLCGALPGPGNTLVCRRQSLVSALRSLEASGTCEREIRRRDRLEQNLDGLLQAAHSRQIRVAPEQRSLELLSTRFEKLPAGITLTPTSLTIAFSGAEDFLEKIGAVVFALQNDYEQVQQFMNEVK